MTTRVIVLDGNENQAVAATRALSRSGHRVDVGSSDTWCKAGLSRYASASFQYPELESDPVGLVDTLLVRLERYGPAVIMPMTERSTLAVSEHRERLLQAGAMLTLAPHETLLRVFDKRAMTDLAQQLGLAVPRTWLVERDEDLSRVRDEASFPVVLKPSSSQQRTAKGGSKATGMPVYAKTPDELGARWDSMRSRCTSALVQEFVPGTGAGYFALMRHGASRGEFAHRRIRDVRPTGSGSALRVSVEPSAAMRDAALRLLTAVSWHGVAMVEFRVRPDGVPVFIEVNGRFWNSLALAVHAGVDFPTGMSRIAAFGDVDALPTGTPGVYCRWLLGDVRHLVAVMLGAPEGYPVPFPSRAGTLFSVLRPHAGMRHDNFELGDPLPALGDWVHFFLRKIPRDVMKRLGRRAA
jgi:predicted ATP-grasp superfamily ATP-dependent carboligase